MGAAGSGDVLLALGDGVQGVPTAGPCVPELAGADILGRCPRDALAPRRAHGQGWGTHLNLALTYIAGAKQHLRSWDRLPRRVLPRGWWHRPVPAPAMGTARADGAGQWALIVAWLGVQPRCCPWYSPDAAHGVATMLPMVWPQCCPQYGPNTAPQMAPTAAYGMALMLPMAWQCICPTLPMVWPQGCP